MKNLGLLLLLVMLSYLVQPPAGSDDSPVDRLYVGQRYSLEVLHDRQITFGGNVEDVLPNSAGTRLAVVTVQSDGQSSTETVSTIGLEHYTVRDYYSATSTPPDVSNIYSGCGGWSRDSRYLSFGVMGMSAGAAQHDIVVIDMSDGGIVHLSALAGGAIAMSRAEWSADDRLAFTSSQIGQSAIDVYDANAQKLQSWPSTIDSAHIGGWKDGHHVQYNDDSADRKYWSIDVSTGSVAVEPGRTPTVSPFVNTMKDAVTAPASNVPLSFDLEVKHAPAVGDDGKGHGSVSTIWLDVYGLPPLTVKRSTVGYLLVESFLDDVFPIFVPHPYDPSSAEVAFVYHGNLYVAPIRFAGASVQEAEDAGEQLTCPEEEQLATENGRQMGLAVIEYEQDYDLHAPPADGFHDAVYPYLKSEEPFMSDRHPFEYELDGDDLSPVTGSLADAEIGSYSLPCARVVVYLDGHVKVWPLTPATSSAAQGPAQKTASPCNCGAGS